MHTNEITYNTFISRWFGRLGNNIQQISNAIYFCEKNKIHFTSPDHPYINAIDLNFGNTEYKIQPNSNNWFYFFEKPDSDFECDVKDLNSKRKQICEQYILPNLKIKKLDKDLPKDVLVIHVRSGDIFTERTHSAYVQNPLIYYITLWEMFKGKVIFIAEDTNNPIVQYFSSLHANILVQDIEDSYSLLLNAKNIATSGVGTFAIAAALCSKELKNLYCTNLYLANTINPYMLKDSLNVYRMDINDNKYIRTGDWRYTQDTIDKVINYSENTSFRRL
jgi:hypothetical protein